MGPDLEVVGAHEEVRDPGAHGAQDPLVEVGGLGAGRPGGLDRGGGEAGQAGDLVLVRQGRDVVLERVGDPAALQADVGDALQGVPVLGGGGDGGYLAALSAGGFLLLPLLLLFPKGVVRAWQRLGRLEAGVDQLVEVAVVGEDDMSSHVVEKPLGSAVGAGEASGFGGLQESFWKREFFFLEA